MLFRPGEKMGTSLGEALHEEDMFAPYTLPTLDRRIDTMDGISLHTLRLGREPDKALILGHGFGGNKNIRDFVALAQDLSESYTVYTFDFRGHGLSTGVSTFGYLEVLDLMAVVDLARRDGNRLIAALGFSMGGVAVIRYAALCGGLDSAVAVSVPADIQTARAPGSLLIRLMMGNPLGRAFAARRYGITVDSIWKLGAPPSSLVHMVAPQPLTIIQGEDDYIFELEQARRLQGLAGRNCRLKTFTDFGHAEQGYGPRLLRYILSILKEDLG
jgi:pimeloyl-ACP methyl ester carboxylesterase